jgi:hypothetical protein
MGANNSMDNKGKSMESGNSMNMSNSRVIINSKDASNSWRPSMRILKM